MNSLQSVAASLRRRIIEQSFAANVGHIGSALSVADIVAVLWAGVMRNPGTDDPHRDRFILAKGHAALALYVAMHHSGLIDNETLNTYCRDGSVLGVHPEHALPGIELSTGSLGQGLSVACGQAYGLRLQGSNARVFALLSDAECNEGQVWEAAMFAGHHRLANLTAIVDVNGTQALGYTRDVLNMESWTDKWRAFGWDAVEIDGHDVAAIHTACSEHGDRPRLIVARTQIGKGVSFMENQVAWHYRPLTPELKTRALADIGGVP